MTRRTLLLGLAAGSALVGAGVSTAVVRALGTDRPGRADEAALGERSIYALRSVWTNDDGRPVRLSELAGRVQLLAMMFTSCPSVCPTFVREIVSLDRALVPKLRERTHVVFVSIDPERDTPGVLRRYRETMRLERERFTLLRGSASDVRELAQVVGVAYQKTEGSDIAHTRLVTVLDATGELIHQQAGVSEDRERLIAGIERASGFGTG
jgi:protein SCO1/2